MEQFHIYIIIIVVFFFDYIHTSGCVFFVASRVPVAVILILHGYYSICLLRFKTMELRAETSFKEPNQEDQITAQFFLFISEFHISAVSCARHHRR